MEDEKRLVLVLLFDMLSRLHAAGSFVLAAFTCAFAFSLCTACTPGAQVAGVRAGVDVALCIAENQDLDEVSLIAKCIRENVTPSDIIRIVTQQRLATKRAAIRATCGGATEPSSSSSITPAPAAPSK